MKAKVKSKVLLGFGRYKGKSLGKVAAIDRDYALWLVRDALFKQVYKKHFFGSLDKYLISEAFYFKVLGLHLDDLEAFRKRNEEVVENARVRREVSFYGLSLREIKRLAKVGHSSSYLGLRFVCELFYDSLSDSDWARGDNYSVFVTPLGAYVRFKTIKTVRLAWLKKGETCDLFLGADSSVCKIVCSDRIIERRGSKIVNKFCVF